MRSISSWIVSTTPDANRPKKISGPVAAAVFIALIAGSFAGGTVLLASSMSHPSDMVIVDDSYE